VRLSRCQREAVALRYLAGLSEDDAAGAMGVSVGSLKVHLRRGLTALGGPLTAEIRGGVCDA
jgi:DNA-directed RNA polymerase specialized sigma24 family protein